MTIAKGVALGPYEILSRIGAGGMGEVWRARDKRIGRDVAVKVLPDEFDDEAVKRFEREARAAGSLNHPGLVTIFDVGTHDGLPYIVMELLEGETLRDAIGDEVGAPLPLRKAIDYAAQAASALAVAHEQGIVHRDLKPENLFITSDRRVKILDFGLAKLVAHAKDGTTVKRTSQHLTAAGFAVGTPAYMSPEQVRAHPIDHRTDIFSLGAVLYEMLSGRPAFDAFSAVETMHAVINQEPAPIEQLVPAVSPVLAAIVNHCLEKEPRERFRSAHDLAFQLRTLPDLESSASLSRQRAAIGKGRQYRAAMIVGPLLLAAAAGGFVVKGLRNGASRAAPQPYRQLTFTDGIEVFPTLSPDGKTFAYVSSQSGDKDIHVQRADSRMPLNVTNDSPEDDSEPAFSPDASLIAFRSERQGGGIFVMGVTGESVNRLTTFGHNPAWSPDGKRIVFSTAQTTLFPHYHQSDGDLWIVDVATTTTRLLFKGNSDLEGSSDALQPSWSPHGNRIAFWGVNRTGRREIATIEPDAPQPATTIVRALDDPSLKWNPVWSPGGRHLYFGSDRNGTLNLWRIRIDERTGVTAGEPELMAIPASTSGNYAFSRQGDLAFATVMRSYHLLALPLDGETAKTGAPQVLFGASQDIKNFAPSPDRSMIAFTTGGGQEDLFVARPDGTRLRQLTYDEAKDRFPAWSPDGSRLYFYSNRAGEYGIWSIHVDGSGLTQETARGNFYNPGVSPDGRMLSVHPPAVVHLDRPLNQRVEAIPGVIHSPQWSPDASRLIGGAFTDAGPRSGLALYTPRTRKVEKILDYGFRPQWFADGKRVLFFTNQSIGILDVDTRQVASSPFTPPSGVQVADSDFPRLSRDGSTLYVRQTLEQGDIWVVRLDQE